jgi:O-antigen/teichoic acid export membrane protein
VYIGVLNGRKKFVPQALFDIGFTSMKATLVLGLAFAGLGVLGAFYGFALAAFLIMLIAVWRIGRDLTPGENAVGLYGFAAQVMLYTLVFNLVFKLDGVLVKPAFTEFFAASLGGWTPSAGDVFAWLSNQSEISEVVRQSADKLMADYGMAVAISRLPWQATIAITFVVFPLVSAATFAHDQEKTRFYVRETMRYTMLLVGCAAVVLVAAPNAVFGLLPAGYERGAEALVWLAPGYFCFSLFNVVNTLLMSAKKAGTALVIGILTVSAAGLFYLNALNSAESAEELMMRAGISTLAAFSLGLFLGIVALWKHFGAALPAMTTIRVLGISSCLVWVVQMLPEPGRWMGVVLALGVALCYIAALFLTREFGPEDRARLQRVLGRRAK